MPSLPRFDPAALLAAIVASSDDAIVSKDLDGIITSWNRGAERIFGYTAEEAIGRSIRMIIPADKQAEEDEVLAKIRRGESVDHFETIRLRKDGTLVPISLTVSPVRLAAGEIVGASKIARDISERWRAQETIARAQSAEAHLQRRLLALVGASGSLLASPRVSEVLPATLRLAAELVAADGYAVWRLFPDSNTWGVGAYSGVSDEFASGIIAAQDSRAGGMLPFSEPLVCADVLATPFLAPRRDIYAREGIRSMLAIPLTIRNQLSGTLVFYYRSPHAFDNVEVQAARALGNLVAAAVTTAELYDEKQQNHERATFLAQAGAALSASLDYHATLKTVAEMAVPHISDWCSIHLVSDEGRIEQLALAHVDPAKLEFARTFEQRYPEDPDSPSTVTTVIRTGKPMLIEQVTDAMLADVARDDAHLADLRRLQISSLMIVPLVARGRTLGALAFVSAESRRRYGAVDLRFAQDVASRAALAVDNARAYEEARRANRLKDDFLATLSHELRTPLNAILGYARMLRTGIMSPEKQARALETLERSAGSLSQIVEDILDVSRIITGKIRLELQPVELPVVVNDAIATVLPAAEAKGVTVRTEIEPAIGVVRADGERLQQVVWNLMSNAVKFTPSGGQVDVHVERTGDHVAVVVRDTGIGFEPEFAPHLFERFRQADSGFSRQHGGLGLGLAIARHLVEMHGGTIEASSEGRGKGATFRVQLPVIARPGAVTAVRSAHRSSAPLGAGALTGLDGIRVLAVDDDPDALSLLREVLETAGATVVAVTDAHGALEELARFRPDALIADLGMPGIDGFELIRKIRSSSNPVVRQVPAVALTAYARSEDRASALRRGFQMHLAKPIYPTELVAAILSLTRQSKTTAS